MPADMRKYPPGWRQFSAWVRHVRAQDRCECVGQCRMHRPNPQPRRCVEVHRRPAIWARGTIHLTVHHLCNCDPPCLDPAHVLAMCQRCHLRADLARHLKTRRQARLRTLRHAPVPPGSTIGNPPDPSHHPPHHNP